MRKIPAALSSLETKSRPVPLGKRCAFALEAIPPDGLDQRKHSTCPARKSDPENGSEVRRRGTGDHTLVVTARGLERLDVQQSPSCFIGAGLALLWPVQLA